MTVRLTIATEAWRRHVDAVAASVDGLVPVVKGNGYGLGRSVLAAIAAELADTIAVGTVYELDELEEAIVPVVLTPTLDPPDRRDVILTVGDRSHVDALHGWGGRVIVKLVSSLQRYGGHPDLVEVAAAAGLDVAGVAIHPPLAGGDAEHRAEIERWLPAIDPALDVWTSHLSPAAYGELPSTHRYRLRLGTALWHGDKSALHLEARVLATRRVSAGSRAGYRQQRLERDATVAMIGAGTAHGVHPLADGRSPFHFERRRLELLEPPHMHTTMAVVGDDQPCPAVGDWVDVQRPLTTTVVDELRWS